MLTHIPLLLIEVIDITWLFANWGGGAFRKAYLSSLALASLVYSIHTLFFQPFQRGMENRNLKRVSSNIFAMVGLVTSLSHVSLQEPPKVPPCWALQGLHSARHVIFQHHHVISAQNCVICTAHRAKQCTAMQNSAKQCTTCIYHHRDFPRSAIISFTWASCSPDYCGGTKKAWGCQNCPSPCPWDVLPLCLWPSKSFSIVMPCHTTNEKPSTDKLSRAINFFWPPLQLHLAWWAGHGCGQARLAGLLLAQHQLQGGGQRGLGLLALPPQHALQVFGQLDKLVSQLGYSSGHLTTPSQSYLINMTTLVMAPLSCTTLLSYLPTRLQIYLYL